MNKKAYYRTLITLKRELDSSCYYSLFETVNIFNKVHEDIQNLSFETFDGGGNTSVVQQHRQGVINSVRNAISNDQSLTNTRQLFRCYMDLESLIETSHIESRPCLSEQLSSFLHCIDEFLTAHEKYRVRYEMELAYQLSFKSIRVTRAYKDLKRALNTILEGYLSPPLEENTLQLELYLANVPSLKQFGIKLVALDDMYAELSNLFNISLSDHPIIIEHIEDGSLLARISGNPLIVGILTTVIGVSSTYYIENYPANKEIVEIKEKVETLDSMFELSKKLQQEGYNVDDMQDNINRSLKKLAKSSDLLLSDQPSIEVNDKVYQMDEQNSTKLLEQSKQKLLENKGLMQEA
ncbi:conserved hypothetical protein [Vibrio crassostreae]|nr:conserved hypothetical protein [Vibrio crassostreae]CAK2690414.1 conserved hypothetical protein [Vibrio crassostreae]CAK2727300.1 conserved hypothetical protein [Vibrio crassostreae]CAK2730001.1 conserved hypothetical protein [Vibrio crassostreae]CAK2730273.1 conserved hypothetical protein [Vibrio crassostreae]